MLIFASFYCLFQQSIVCTQVLLNYVLSPVAVVQSIIYYPHFRWEDWSVECQQQMSPSVPRPPEPCLCFHLDTQWWVCHVPVTDLSDNTAVNIWHSGAEPLCTYYLAASSKYYPEASKVFIVVAEKPNKMHGYFNSCCENVHSCQTFLSLPGKHLNLVCFWVLGIMIVKHFII